MSKLFRSIVSASDASCHVISPTLDAWTNFPLGEIQGSTMVLQARLFDLSPANYLRMLRDVYGAELIGKKSKYISALFRDTNSRIDEVIGELNRRANLLLEK